MRAFVKHGRLHVVTQEYTPMIGQEDIPEEEMVFDENWTAIMRLAFYRELNEKLGGKKVEEKEENA